MKGAYPSFRKDLFETMKSYHDIQHFKEIFFGYFSTREKFVMLDKRFGNRNRHLCIVGVHPWFQIMMCWVLIVAVKAQDVFEQSRIFAHFHELCCCCYCVSDRNEQKHVIVSVLHFYLRCGFMSAMMTYHFMSYTSIELFNYDLPKE